MKCAENCVAFVQFALLNRYTHKNRFKSCITAQKPNDSKIHLNAVLLLPESFEWPVKTMKQTMS